MAAKDGTALKHNPSKKVVAFGSVMGQEGQTYELQWTQVWAGCLACSAAPASSVTCGSVGGGLLSTRLYFAWLCTTLCCLGAENS